MGNAAAPYRGTDVHDNSTRSLPIEPGFSLAQTCGPAAWVGARSPRHQWSDSTLTSVERENGVPVWRNVVQPTLDRLDITGNADPSQDVDWGRRVLGLDVVVPDFDDPVIAAIASEFPGLRPMNDGSLFEGIVTAIVGQSISVAAAAVTQAKLARRFGDPIHLDGRDYWPLPSAEQLADASLELVRESGVTWKRAEAIQVAARASVAGELPSDNDARSDPDAVVKTLVAFPGIGRWTAESAVLWGVGAVNAHPTGDVALLRAAKAAYVRPELTLKLLDALAEQWRPARGIAARLLWTKFFGPALSGVA
jgi:DNA-3-methyladenine glycosylase II